MRARRFLIVSSQALALAAVLSTAATAQEDKLEDRAKSAAHVLANLVSDPKNSPPNKLLRSAVCIAIIPSVKTAAFVVGGQAGTASPPAASVTAGASPPTSRSRPARSASRSAARPRTWHSSSPTTTRRSSSPGPTSRSADRPPSPPVRSAAPSAPTPTSRRVRRSTPTPPRAPGSSPVFPSPAATSGWTTRATAPPIPRGRCRSSPTSRPMWPRCSRPRADTKNTPAIVKPFTAALEKRIGGTR